MIAELGKYAGAVLAAYGVTILMLFCIGVASIVQSWRTGRMLQRLEAAAKDTKLG